MLVMPKKLEFQVMKRINLTQSDGDFMLLIICYIYGSFIKLMTF